MSVARALGSHARCSVLSHKGHHRIPRNASSGSSRLTTSALHADARSLSSSSAARASPASQVQVPKKKLRDSGSALPMMGLGTWKSPRGKTWAAVKGAVLAGYRHIDCANDYDNEREIGLALKELFQAGVVKREELFIQCKLWNGNHRKEHVPLDLAASLEDLQLDYVDSFVIHWPQACPSTGKQAALRKNGARHGPASQGVMFPVDEETGLYCSDNDSHYVETWHAMEALVDKGLTRTIGLSNFNQRQIQETMNEAKKHQPCVLQNECHPYFQQKDLLDFCNQAGIVFQAYSPLGSYDRPWAKDGDREVFDDPIIAKLAAKHERTPAQIIVRWHLQRGVCVVPKSVTPSRIVENISVFDFSLSDNDMALMASINVGWRHLLWPETSMHPDYPFKDDLPHRYTPGPAPTTTTSSSR